MFQVLNDLHAELITSSGEEFADIKQTVEAIQTKLGHLEAKRPVGEVFDICFESLNNTLDHCAQCVRQLKSPQSSPSQVSDEELFLELGDLDFLIKQKTDQIHFIFVNDDGLAPPATRLTDEAARRFWVTSFGSTAGLVPWKEFVAALVTVSGNASGSASGRAGGISESDEAALTHFLGRLVANYVSVYEMELFMKSFGPLTGCVNRLLSPFRQGILVGYVSAYEANLMLKDHGIGSFLIRFSKSQPGAFAVTYVDEELSNTCIKNTLLINAKPHGLRLNKSKIVYSSLDEFVSAHKGHLVFPVRRSLPVDKK
jgi:hypothetical protein